MSAVQTGDRQWKLALETRDEELDRLVQEQTKDDVYFIPSQASTISLDAKTDGGFFVADFIGTDEDGFPVSFLKIDGKTRFSTTGKHGTIYAYRRLRCRCLKCRQAQADHQRAYRQQKKAAA